MKEKFMVTNGQLVGFICCALLPAGAIGIGAWMLIRGAVLTPTFSVAFFVIPLIAVGLLAWCIFCRGEGKAILSALILLVYVLLSLVSVCVAEYVVVKHYDGMEAEQRYLAVKQENQLMPDLSGIGQPMEIEYHFVFCRFMIIACETDYLICRYSPEEYENQKARLEEAYVFQDEQITAWNSSCEPKTDIDGYEFQLLAFDAYQNTLDFPKKAMMIGHSDDAREIVYVMYRDTDLDCISSLKEFIVDDCGWKHIR